MMTLLTLLFLNYQAFAQNYHIVEDRDSLMTISNEHYHTHQCWQIIFRANKQLDNADVLEVGEELFIPPLKKCQKSPLFRNKRRKKKEIVFEEVSTPEKVIIAKTPIKLEAQEIKENEAPLLKIIKKHSSIKTAPKPQKKLSQNNLIKEQIFEDEVIFEDKPIAPRLAPKKNQKPIVKKTKTIHKNSPLKYAYQIQFAAYATRTEAQALVNELDEFDIKSRIEKAIFDSGATWFRVRSRPFSSRQRAKAYAHNKQIPYVQSDYIIVKIKFR